jgi:MOSC N-terminal beta barrel domain
MPIEIGTIEAIFRYPVKSMRGESLDAAALGWHGLEGDRLRVATKMAKRYRLTFARRKGKSCRCSETLSPPRSRAAAGGVLTFAAKRTTHPRSPSRCATFAA